MAKASSSRFLLVLVSIYAALCALLAVRPVDRPTWWAENITVWVVLGAILILYRCGVHFSMAAYALMFVFIYLHTVGGHYTFALVPFASVTQLLGFSRNNFDRFAHFSVGLYAFGVAERLQERRLVRTRFLLFTYPVFFIATVAMAYELIEWLFAAVAAPEAGAAYLGSQGDEWDAQKDMLCDTLGAISAVVLFYCWRVRGKAEPEAELSSVQR